MDTLPQVSQWLGMENISCVVEDNTLLAIIDERRDGTPQTMELRITNETSDCTVIECQMEITFVNSVETLREMSSFLSFINRIGEPPGFFLHELEDVVYYRYVWIGTHLEQMTWNLIIEKITSIYDTYKDIIRDVAEGQLTFQQALEKL